MNDMTHTARTAWQDGYHKGFDAGFKAAQQFAPAPNPRLLAPIQPQPTPPKPLAPTPVPAQAATPIQPTPRGPRGPYKKKPVPPTTMRAKEVAAYIGVSRASIYRMLAANQFPQPIRLRSRIVVWERAAVDAWIEQHLTKA